MDRNTVIRAIENCIDKPKCRDCPWETCERDHEHVEMPLDLVQQALGMLKQQEPNEDWISRKRLKDEIKYYIDEAGWGDEVNKVLGWCMEFIDNQRAVKWE